MAYDWRTKTLAKHSLRKLWVSSCQIEYVQLGTSLTSKLYMKKKKNSIVFLNTMTFMSYCEVKNVYLIHEINIFHFI